MLETNAFSAQTPWIAGIGTSPNPVPEAKKPFPRLLQPMKHLKNLMANLGLGKGPVVPPTIATQPPDPGQLHVCCG